MDEAKLKDEVRRARAITRLPLDVRVHSSGRKASVVLSPDEYASHEIALTNWNSEKEVLAFLRGMVASVERRSAR